MARTDLLVSLVPLLLGKGNDPPPDEGATVPPSARPVVAVVGRSQTGTTRQGATVRGSTLPALLAFAALAPACGGDTLPAALSPDLVCAVRPRPDGGTLDAAPGIDDHSHGDIGCPAGAPADIAP